MFTDRLFAWRISSTRALVACPRSGVWHLSGPITDKSRTAQMPFSECHPRTARGVFQPGEFDHRWRLHDGADALSPAFLDTLPARSGLMAKDMKPLRRGPLATTTPAAAEGYAALESGRVVVACPSCSGWHVVELDDAPMPGYRFNAMKLRDNVGCAAMTMRVTVQASSWDSSWGKRCGQGRQLSIIQTPAYVNHLTASSQPRSLV